jgi:Leucine-rich repeat (LRR) protein
VEVSLDAPLAVLCSFASWLPQHAALVSSITVKTPVKTCNQEKGDGLRLEAAQQLLQQAMQLATALPAAAARSNTAAAVQQQQPVRLPNISSITLAGDGAMLRVLPAHSLTHLSLQWLPCSSGSATAAAALAKLSNLQQLHIQTLYDDSNLGSFLTGVAQLSRLTSLELDYVDSSRVEELLQVLAQPLPLQVLRFTCLRDDKLRRLDLSHHTQLQELSARAGWEELDVIFPPQLQQLQLVVASSTQIEVLMALRHLRRLKLTVRFDEPALLLRLTQLPALQQLPLEYGHSRFAVATAAAWPQLPQLNELELFCLGDFYEGSGLPSRKQWQGILDGVAASTHLTRLALDVHVDVVADIEHVPAYANALTSLRQLQDLCINYTERTHMPGDALSLTALTGLTRLVLAMAGAGVGDLAATAIAGSCKQLQHLDLVACELGSMACLANIRHLIQLTELCLEGNAGLKQQGLMLLTGLMQLQQLGVDRTADITEEVVDSFWAAVRGQLQ